MNKAQSAAKAKEILKIADRELRHRAFDQLINAIARAHGHGLCVDIFESAIAEEHTPRNLP